MTGKSVFLLEAENRTLEQLGLLDSKVVFYSVCKHKQTIENVEYKGKGSSSIVFNKYPVCTDVWKLYDTKFLISWVRTVQI